MTIKKSEKEKANKRENQFKMYADKKVNSNRNLSGIRSGHSHEV